MKHCVLFLFVFVGIGVCSDDYAPDGNHLLPECQKSVASLDSTEQTDKHMIDAYEDGYCVGLVQGVADVSNRVCAASGVNNGETIRVVVRYLQTHPQELHQRNTFLIQKALSEAFPCEH